MSKRKLTVKELRAQAEGLGITEASAGMPLEDLLARAQAQEDPTGYLAAFAAPPEDREESAGAAAPISPEIAAADVPPQVVLATIAAVPLGCVPIEEVRAGRYYLSEHVDVPLTSEPQRLALRRLFLGLDARRPRLAGGRRVASNADAVRWLLERIEGGDGCA